MRLGGRLAFVSVIAVALQFGVVAPAQAGISYVSRFNTPAPFNLHGPWGMTVDDLGNTYVADTGGHRIVKFGPSGNPIRDFGNGNSELEGEKGFLYYPTGITFANNSLYVVDASSTVNVFSTNGTSTGQWGVPGTGPGQLNVPAGLGADCAGNIYIANSRNNRIDEFDKNGTPITAFGINKVGVPTGIAMASGYGSSCVDDGGIYVSDEYDGTIVKFSNDHQYVETIGTQGPGPLQFRGPEELALSREAGSANATLWVAESGGGRVQQLVSSDGGGTWSYGGEITDIGDGSHFPSTHALSLTPDDKLLVAPTNGYVYEFADKAPKLSILQVSDHANVKHDHYVGYGIVYNQLNKSCVVHLTAEFDVPHDNFTLKQRIPDVGAVYATAKLALSDAKYKLLKRVWKNGKRVPLHTTATGHCSDDVHVTAHHTESI